MEKTPALRGSILESVNEIVRAARGDSSGWIVGVPVGGDTCGLFPLTRLPWFGGRGGPPSLEEVRATNSFFPFGQRLVGFFQTTPRGATGEPPQVGKDFERVATLFPNFYILNCDGIEARAFQLSKGTWKETKLRTCRGDAFTPVEFYRSVEVEFSLNRGLRREETAERVYGALAAHLKENWRFVEFWRGGVKLDDKTNFGKIHKKFGKRSARAYPQLTMDNPRDFPRKIGETSPGGLKFTLKHTFSIFLLVQRSDTLEALKKKLQSAFLLTLKDLLGEATMPPKSRDPLIPEVVPIQFLGSLILPKFGKVGNDQRCKLVLRHLVQNLKLHAGGSLKKELPASISDLLAAFERHFPREDVRDLESLSRDLGAPRNENS
ncbi:MAG: hypothetical protein ACTSU5_08605 [Promethearchaeota archaeon]